MKILSFGSINIDHVYTVEQFVRPGETLGCNSYRKYCGGKGCNQSIALAHAGAQVYHAGKIGSDGEWIKTRMDESGVDTSLVEKTEGYSGHAVIQVTRQGENAIIIHGGANRSIKKDYITKVFKNFTDGDYLLLQNEISGIPEIMVQGAEHGMVIAFNPSPMNKDVLDYPLDLVSYFILNEIEGRELTGEQEPEKILLSMGERFPGAALVLTMGSEGVLFKNDQEKIGVTAQKVVPVDTTAAGDTFIGFFLADIMRTGDPHSALTAACKAAEICVTKPGAADSIPKRSEVDRMSS